MFCGFAFGLKKLKKPIMDRFYFCDDVAECPIRLSRKTVNQPPEKPVRPKQMCLLRVFR